MKTIRQLLTYSMIFVSSTLYSQSDTCIASFCYSAVFDTSNGLIVTFQNNSTSDNPIAATFWDFGDGNTSTVFNPIHNYFFLGNTFIVTLAIFSSTNCLDTYTDTVAMGNSCDSINNVFFLPEKEEINLFPTIVNSTFKVVNNKYTVPVHFSLIDEFGKTVLELFLSGLETEICRPNLPNGIYFYKIDTAEKLIKSGKLIFD